MPLDKNELRDLADDALAAAVELQMAAMHLVAATTDAAGQVAFAAFRVSSARSRTEALAAKLAAEAAD